MRTRPIDARLVQIEKALFLERVRSFVSTTTQSVQQADLFTSSSAGQSASRPQVSYGALTAPTCQGALSPESTPSVATGIRFERSHALMLGELNNTLRLVKSQNAETRALGYYNRGAVLFRFKLELAYQRSAFEAAVRESPRNALYRACFARASMETSENTVADWNVFGECLDHDMFREPTQALLEQADAAKVFSELAYALQTEVQPDAHALSLTLCRYAERACMNAFNLNPTESNRLALEEAKRDMLRSMDRSQPSAWRIPTAPENSAEFTP